MILVFERSIFMNELQWSVYDYNHNNDFLKDLRKDLKKDFTKEEIDVFISNFNLVFFDKWINLWKYVYCYNNRAKKQNHKEWDNSMLIDLWILVDWIFNILILDLWNNKIYYFSCYIDRIVDSYAIDWINADSLLQILDNDKNLFKEYLLDLMLSSWFSFQNMFDVLIWIQNNNQVEITQDKQV